MPEPSDSPTTQDNRLLAINTPLGKDVLLLEKLRGTEGLSRLYSFDADLLHEEDYPGFQATNVDSKQLVGQSVYISIIQEDTTIREITGIINRFSKGGRDTRFSFYSARIVPHVWILTQKFQSRIFQNMSVPDILKSVFDGFDVGWEIQ